LDLGLRIGFLELEGPDPVQFQIRLDGTGPQRDLIRCRHTNNLRPIL